LYGFDLERAAHDPGGVTALAFLAFLVNRTQPLLRVDQGGELIPIVGAEHRRQREKNGGHQHQMKLDPQSHKTPRTAAAATMPPAADSCRSTEHCLLSADATGPLAISRHAGERFRAADAPRPRLALTPMRCERVRMLPLS
jgi:hypothetical protein